MTSPLRHMPRPCDETDVSGRCPFRRDAEPGEFPAERFERLADTAGRPGREAPMNAPVFACHHTQDGAEVACAGWLAVCGHLHLGMRFAFATGRLNPAKVGPLPGWPELFGSYDEMAAAQSGGRPYDLDAANARRAAGGHDSDDVISKIRGGRRERD